MKNIVFILGLILCTSTAKAQETGTFKDKRDGQIYKTVTIGSQIWFAENLKFKPSGEVLNYKDKKNLKTYGYLYISKQATNVCPEGWHLPTIAEWDTLAYYIKKTKKHSNDDDFSSYGIYYHNNVGKHLKSKTGWSDEGNGQDTFNFNALPAGMHNYDGYVGVGSSANWWSIEKNIIMLVWKNDDLMKNAPNPFTGDVIGFSVRCVKD